MYNHKLSQTDEDQSKVIDVTDFHACLGITTCEAKQDCKSNKEF